MTKETTSTNPVIGDEEYKGTDQPETKGNKTHNLEIDHLSDSELLALLISPGCSKRASEIAQTLLQTFDNNLLDIFTASIHQLTQVKDIGFARACTILAAFELGKRSASFFEENNPPITTPEDVIKLLAPFMRFLKQEEFKVILLDSRKRLINHYRVSLGGLDSTIVDPRDVLRPAITAQAPYSSLSTTTRQEIPHPLNRTFH